MKHLLPCLPLSSRAWHLICLTTASLIRMQCQLCVCIKRGWIFLVSKALFCIKISALSSLSEDCHGKAVQQVDGGLRLVTLFLALSVSGASLQKHCRPSARDGLAHFKGGLWCFCTHTGLGQKVEGAWQACPGCFPCLVHLIFTNNTVFTGEQ